MKELDKHIDSHIEADSKEEGISTAKKKKVVDTPTKEKKNARGWYTIAGFTIIILGVAIGFYRYSNQAMDTFLVSGNYYTEETDIKIKAQIPSAVNPDSVDLYAVIKRVETLPFVKEAIVNLVPPNKVDIQIIERQPLAILMDGSKKALVDIDGVLLPLIVEKTPDLPLLYGFEITKIGDTLKTESYKITSRFLTDLSERPLSNETISEIAWSSGNEGLIALSNENGIKLIFGTEITEYALSNWEAFLSQIAPKVGMQSVAEVDLRFKNQIITR